MDLNNLLFLNWLSWILNNSNLAVNKTTNLQDYSDMVRMTQNLVNTLIQLPYHFNSFIYDILYLDVFHAINISQCFTKTCMKDAILGCRYLLLMSGNMHETRVTLLNFCVYDYILPFIYIFIGAPYIILQIPFIKSDCVKRKQEQNKVRCYFYLSHGVTCINITFFQK